MQTYDRETTFYALKNNVTQYENVTPKSQFKRG